MMELKQVIETRATVRQFAKDSLNAGDLREMVRLAGRAPSINNSQPWHYIAITNPELLGRMAETVLKELEDLLPICDGEDAVKAKAQVQWFSTFFKDAPAVFAIAVRPYHAIADDAISCNGLTHEELNALRGYPDLMSIGASVQTLLLAAVDMGYAGCWMSGPLVAREELEGILAIKDPERLAAMVAIGKPAITPHQREKKPVDEIFEIRG